MTPVESSPSLTTKSDAMKITVGSPKPASDCSRSRTPVAQSESATPERDDADREVIPDEDGHRHGQDQEGDRRLAHRTRSAADVGVSAGQLSRDGQAQPGPRGMPTRYQATKNSVQMTDSTRTYGSIIATTVPMPASLPVALREDDDQREVGHQRRHHVERASRRRGRRRAPSAARRRAAGRAE